MMPRRRVCQQKDENWSAGMYHLVLRKCSKLSAVAFHNAYSVNKRTVLLVFGVAIGFSFLCLFGGWQFDGLKNRWCFKRTNIVFLKTHKCASSAIQNIFLRFGDRENLTFVLPYDTNYIGHPEPFAHDMVPDVRHHGKEYNILAHHTRLNVDELRRVMPKNSVFVTILRDPVDVVESMFSYYELSSFFNFSLADLENDSMPWFETFSEYRLYGRIGRNQMSFDLGLDPVYFDDIAAINDFIVKIDETFDLVMISERMDESLILLRKLLCWDLDDVITLRNNARKSDFKTSLSVDAKSKIRSASLADELLYTYFLGKFQTLLKRYDKGELNETEEEVRQRTKEVYKRCVEKEVLVDDLDSGERPTHWYSDQVLMFKSTGKGGICDGILRGELDYTEFLRKKQIDLFDQVD